MDTTLGVAEAQARFEAILAPWLHDLGMRIQEVGKGFTRILVPHNPHLVHNRGVVSGQSLLAVADASMVVAIAGWYGRFVPVATISLNMNFMRPATAGVVTETRLHRVGRRVVFGDAMMTDEGSGALLAQATITYTVLEETGK